jgi:hypothetical protein
MSSLLPIALRFATQGIVAVPTASDGSKRPMLPTWKEFQDRQPTQDELLGWFNNETIQGLGVITGRISGNLEMLELEGRAVADKMHLQIAEIATSSGLADVWEKINAGYVEMTPSGGLHWLYRLESPVAGNLKLARRPGENGGVEVLAETRGEGGFSICAPSAGTTHPSGGSWQLLRGSIEQIPTLTDAEHTALHSLFALFDQMPKAESIAQEVSNKVDGILSAGDDYNSRTTWDEILIPLGWSKVYNKGEATVWRRPGKNEGISATTNFNGNNKLFVFSTSTVFDSETSYSKFAAYAHLHHHGNFKNAAADLRNQGYGAQGLNSFDLSNALMPSNQLMPYENVGTSEASRAGVDEESSWKPIALKDYYDGLFATPIATMLKRTDGNGLIYTGRVHSIYGESESGKSWVAQIASAECLKSDKKVIYIDFESDAVDIVNRLKSLGVSRANLLQYFTYIRPDGPRDADDPYWQAILESGSAELIIIDGVTESLTMWGGETKDNDAITRWMRIFPRTVATASGAAVVLIDHITKNAETRGRFAIGGQAKLATIDGAAYLVEPLEALAPGRVGSLTMRVTKDRPGYIRKIAGMWRKSDRTQEAAVLMIDSTRPLMQYAITVPMIEDELEANKEFKKSKEIVEFIHNHPGCTRRLIQEGVQGSKDAIGERISDLITGGWIANKGNDRSFILYITDEGKSHFNLLDAQITELKVN